MSQEIIKYVSWRLKCTCPRYEFVVEVELVLKNNSPPLLCA